MRKENNKFFLLLWTSSRNETGELWLSCPPLVHAVAISWWIIPRFSRYYRQKYIESQSRDRLIHNILSLTHNFHFFCFVFFFFKKNFLSFLTGGVIQCNESAGATSTRWCCASQQYYFSFSIHIHILFFLFFFSQYIYIRLIGKAAKEIEK